MLLVFAAGFIATSRPPKDLVLFSVIAILVARVWSLVFDFLFVEAPRTAPVHSNHQRPFFLAILDYVGFEIPLTGVFAVIALVLFPITILETLACAFFLTCFYTLFWFLVEWNDY